MQIELIVNSKSNLASEPIKLDPGPQSDEFVHNWLWVEDPGESPVLSNSGDTTHALQHIGNRPFFKAPHYGPISLFVDIL